MEIAFTKMHGLGNDFIVIDDRSGEINSRISYEELSKQLCARHFGIGGDGILIILDSRTHDIKFRIFNADGSEAGMCGNGIRCFATYLMDRGIVKDPVINIETRAGTIVTHVLEHDARGVARVRVDMGEPCFEPEKIPFVSDAENVIEKKLEVNGRDISVTALSVGNPNAVIFVDNVSTINVAEQGRAVEIHEKFPEKTNVEFVEVLNPREIKMRVWERGAGETMACGTGACAALVACHITGRTKDSALIHLAGGDLDVQWDRTSNHIFKTGPAVLVFEGGIKF
ncbi:MAG: diaminopimelate epimerase [Desulfobacteraceae bacterium]